MENLNVTTAGIHAGTLRKGLGYGTRAMGQNWQEVFTTDNPPDDMDIIPYEQAKKFLENLLGPKQGRRESIKVAARTLLQSHFEGETVAETFPAVSTQRAPAKKRTASDQERPTQTPSLFTRFMDWVAGITIAQVRTFLFDLLLFLIIFGHALLIWYDCSESWGIPGQIAGGMSFLIVAATVIVATDASKNITSEMAVWFDLVLCAGSFFVHYPTFLKYSTVDPKVTMCLCIVIPTISWVSLYFYRHSKNA